MTLDEKVLAEAKALRDRLIEAEHELERVRADYHHAIRRLQAAGGSLREVAEELGLSHQRVHQIVELGFALSVGQPAPFFRGRRRHRRGGHLFENFGEGGRNVVVDAQGEADRLGHDYIGTEHILLGVLAARSSVPAKALKALGVKLPAVRKRVEEIVGRGTGTGGPKRFTPRAKKVLELALREALRRGDPEIAEHHLLLGLSAEGEGVAAKILDELGADERKVCAAIDSVLAVTRTARRSTRSASPPAGPE